MILAHLYINDYLLPLKSFLPTSFWVRLSIWPQILVLIPVVLNMATDPPSDFITRFTQEHNPVKSQTRNEPYSLSDELYNHNEGLINRTNSLASRNTHSTGTK